MSQEAYSVKLIWAPRDMRSFSENEINGDYLNAYYMEGKVRLLFSIVPNKKEGSSSDSWIVFAYPSMRKELGCRWITRSVIYDRLIDATKKYDYSDKLGFADRMAGRKFGDITIDESCVHGWSFILVKEIKRKFSSIERNVPSKRIFLVLSIGLFFAIFPCSHFNENCNSTISQVLVVLVLLGLLVQFIEFFDDLKAQRVVNNAVLSFITLGNKRHSIKFSNMRATIKRFWIRYALTMIALALLMYLAIYFS